MHATSRSRSTRAIPALLALLVLAACGGGDGSPSAAGSAGESAADGGARVELSGFAFVPAELTVAAGTTVTFANLDGAPHTITHGSDGTAVDAAIVDEDLPAGEELTVTFDEPGTYPITCTIHPTMNMTIVVEG
jgi:plastocyanin